MAFSFRTVHTFVGWGGNVKLGKSSSSLSGGAPPSAVGTPVIIRGSCKRKTRQKNIHSNINM